MNPGPYQSAYLTPIAVSRTFAIIVCAVIWLLVDGWLRTRRSESAKSPIDTKCLQPSILLKPLLYILIIIVLGYFCSMGLYSEDKESLKLAINICAACALGSLFQHRVCSFFQDLYDGRILNGKASDEDRPQGLNARRIILRIAHVVFTLAGLALLTYLCHLMIEMPWNDRLQELNPTYFWLELAEIALALGFVFLLAQRHGGGAKIIVWLSFIIGVAQYFVIRFKGAVIAPMDLLALGTAAEVSGGYVYSFGHNICWVIDLLAPALLLCSYIQPIRTTASKPVETDVSNIPTPTRIRHTLLHALPNLIGAVACFIALICFTSIPVWRTTFGVNATYWDTIGSAKTNGFLPNFTVNVQELAIKKPDGYSDKKAEELENDYTATYDKNVSTSYTEAEAQFKKQKPTVIVVMDETFSDLSIYDVVKKAGYQGPEYIKNAMTDALAKGPYAVSVRGGGTCDTEFEFLTGISMGFVGGGKYPYTAYNLSNAPSLARQLSDLGYKTSAMHPNNPANWHRKRAWEQLGFQNTYFIEDFPKDAQTLHSGLRDSATYDKILELLNKDDSPQFIFDVTMANHSSYDQHNIPSDILTNYKVEGGEAGTDQANAELNEYLSCINVSDADLKDFVEKLRKIDRPVVLAYFGDHQPNFILPLNDASFTGETELVHNERTYQTVYTIWANYDVAGNDQTSQKQGTSSSYLAAKLMQSIGAPLTSYQKAELVCAEKIPFINAIGFQSSDGSWSAIDSGKSSLVNDLQTMAYLEFARKV